MRWQDDGSTSYGKDMFLRHTSHLRETQCDSLEKLNLKVDLQQYVINWIQLILYHRHKNLILKAKMFATVTFSQLLKVGLRKCGTGLQQVVGIA